MLHGEQPWDAEPTDRFETPRWNEHALERIFIRMANQRPRLLEVKVIPLKPEWWEWQVCEDDKVIISGFETSRETAQIEADGTLFFLLSQS